MSSSRLVRSYTLPAVTPFAASVMFFEALNFLAVMPLPVVEHRPESRARCPQRKDEVGDSFVVAAQQVRAWVRTRPEATLRPGQASGRRIGVRRPLRGAQARSEHFRRQVGIKEPDRQITHLAEHTELHTAFEFRAERCGI